MSLPERFTSKVLVDPVTGCHEWQAYRARDGYGRYSVGGRMVLAHRFAYEEAVGPIPFDRMSDHLCRNRGCVNPDHIEPVTNRENQLRGQAPTLILHRLGRCHQGHVDISIHSNGRRTCRTCDARRHRESRDRMRAA